MRDSESRVHLAEISEDFSAASRATLLIFSPRAACVLKASCMAWASIGKAAIMSCIILVTSLVLLVISSSPLAGWGRLALSRLADPRYMLHRSIARGECCGAEKKAPCGAPDLGEPGCC